MEQYRKRIKVERKRLEERYADLPDETLSLVSGLLDRAAYLRVNLEDMEEDMDVNGRIEMFTQSPSTPPYERERPVVRQYIAFNKEYHAIIKTMNTYMSKEGGASDDGFDAFALERDVS